MAMRNSLIEWNMLRNLKWESYREQCELKSTVFTNLELWKENVGSLHVGQFWLQRADK